MFDKTTAQEIFQKINDTFGLDYSKNSYIAFKKLEKFALKNNFTSFEDVKKSILKDNLLYEKLINMLTVGETYFFRELKQIEILSQEIPKNKSVNILCAPCSSGEEVYSIILYLKSKNLLNDKIKITGIDINSNVLEKAREGIYSNRSLSQLPISLKNKYFKIKNNLFHIDNNLKKAISFKKINIFDPDIDRLGNFDIIFSRNMLIYFDDKSKKKAINQFYKLLKTDGLLFLGHADLSCIPNGFKKYSNYINIFYKSS